MARPKKEGLDYFPHDTDATGDIKIEAMLLLYGGVGYAFYFMLLELIYRDANQELDISDAETIQILSRKLRVSEDEYHRMLNTALARGLFDQDYYAKTGRLTSSSIKRRAFPIVSKREKSGFSYEKSRALVSDAETIQKLDRNDTKKRKEKQSIEKKSKEEISCRASPTSELIAEIVSFLNLTIGTSYKPACTTTRKKITARLNEGFTLDDFKTVILKKSAEWADNPDMSKYLRPETLFGTKFESYLNQPDTAPKGNPYLDMLKAEGFSDEQARDNRHPQPDKDSISRLWRR